MLALTPHVAAMRRRRQKLALFFGYATEDKETQKSKQTVNIGETLDSETRQPEDLQQQQTH